MFITTPRALEAEGTRKTNKIYIRPDDSDDPDGFSYSFDYIREKEKQTKTSSSRH